MSQEIKTNKKDHLMLTKMSEILIKEKNVLPRSRDLFVTFLFDKVPLKNRQLKERLFWLPVPGHSPTWQGNHGSERKLFILGGLLRPPFSLSEVRDCSPGVVSPTVRVGLPTQVNPS